MLVLKGKRQRIDVLAFAPSGSELVSAACGGLLQRWRFTLSASPESLFDFNLDRYPPFSNAFYVSKGQVILAASGEGFRVHPLSSQGEWQPAVLHKLQNLTILTISRDETAIIGHGRLERNGLPGIARWVANETGRFQLKWVRDVSDVVCCDALAFLPCGQRFAVCEVRRATGKTLHAARLVVREVKQGEVVATYPCPYVFVEQFSVSPDDRWLLARSRMGLLIWTIDDLATTPRKLLNDNRKHFTGVAFHPSGRYLAATSNDATVKFYDTATWQMAKAFTWSIGRLRSIAFSPDGLLAAAGSDSGKIVVWDVDL